MNYKKKCHGTEENHNDGHLKYIVINAYQNEENCCILS